MKVLKLLLVLLPLLNLGCRSDVAPEYLEAEIVGQGCKAIAQIKGSTIGDTWQGYENCVLINNPDSDKIPAEMLETGEIFYFKSYELTTPPICNGEGINPGISIRALNFSTEKS